MKIGVLGSQGRMGKLLVQLLETEPPPGWALHQASGRNDQVEPLLDCDLIIEFSHPDAVLNALRQSVLLKKKDSAWIIASTGWKLEQRKELEEYAKKTWMVAGSNFSLGVMAFQHILKASSLFIDKLKMRPVIIESHHQNKKDAPSGTAITLQRILSPKGPGNVQTHSVRAGEIVGNHQVRLISQDEEITLTHNAENRSVFAKGSIEAGLWLLNQKSKQAVPPGLISVEQISSELLGLDKS